MQPITSIAALWQEATTDPEFGFALKAQGVRVDLATAVARSAMPKSQLAAQLGWTSDRLEKALSGSGDLSLQTIFAITRALGLDFKVVIMTPDATSATDGNTKEETDAPEICPACGLGHLTPYSEAAQMRRETIGDLADLTVGQVGFNGSAVVIEVNRWLEQLGQPQMTAVEANDIAELIYSAKTFLNDNGVQSESEPTGEGLGNAVQDGQATDTGATEANQAGDANARRKNVQTRRKLIGGLTNKQNRTRRG